MRRTTATTTVVNAHAARIMARLTTGAAATFLSLSSVASTAFLYPMTCPISSVHARKPRFSSSVESDHSNGSNALEHGRFWIKNNGDSSTVPADLAVRIAEVESLRHALDGKDEAFFIAAEALESSQQELVGKMADPVSALREAQLVMTMAEKKLGRTREELARAQIQIKDLEEGLQKKDTELSSTREELSEARRTISELCTHLEQNALGEAVDGGEVTEAEDTIPILNDWHLDEDGAVMGTVVNHPDIEDGTTILTSPLADPATALARCVVTTASGSRYRLEGSLECAKSAPGKDDLRLRLNGEVLGGEGGRKYLLAGEPKNSSAGRSQIWYAFRADDAGKPTGEALAVKLSSNRAAMEREWDNYRRVNGRASSAPFVSVFDFVSEAGHTELLAEKCALVMERGALGDVKQYMVRRGGAGFGGNALREAALAAAQCIQRIHSSKLIWTDLKIENFVVTKEGEGSITIKAIDLESAIGRGGRPVDFSPESCPPEFAAAFLSGEGQDFFLDYSYDIWSLGTFLYELCTGRGLFEGMTPSEIAHLLPTFRPGLDAENIEDSNLMNLISLCLQPDPKKRPTISRVLSHPFFSRGKGLSFLRP